MYPVKNSSLGSYKKTGWILVLVQLPKSQNQSLCCMFKRQVCIR